MKFRKRPVVVEAMQFDGSEQSFRSIVAWAGAECDGWVHDSRDRRIVIPTLEGDMEAAPGDWIIRGIKGEFYPCKPDIFAATYEPVADADEPLDVIVNGRTHKILPSWMPYETVVGMAGGAPLTVTWSAPGGRGGELGPGERVFLEPGMVFTAVHTGGA